MAHCPAVQPDGAHYSPATLPGFVDRRGRWCSTLASTVIGMALARVSYDYLSQRPPCFLDEPYQIQAVLSYCDTRLHRGTIYRASGFTLARANTRGIETWVHRGIAVLTKVQDATIRRLAETSQRSQRYRARRAQLELGL